MRMAIDSQHANERQAAIDSPAGRAATRGRSPLLDMATRPGAATKEQPQSYEGPRFRGSNETRALPAPPVGQSSSSSAVRATADCPMAQGPPTSLAFMFRELEPNPTPPAEGEASNATGNLAPDTRHRDDHLPHLDDLPPGAPLPQGGFTFGFR